MPDHHCTRLAGGALAALALAGCTVGPDFHTPAPPRLGRFTEAPLPPSTPGATKSQHFATGEDVTGDWWALFRAPKLTALVAAALRQNPSLQAAQQTLHQAQETTLAAEGGWLPSLSGAINRQRQELSAAEGGLHGAGQTFSVYTAALSVSYTFDIWGLTRRTVEADNALAQYQRSQLEGATNMLAANTATAAITAASLAAQVAVEQQLVTAERALLTTVRRQFDLGGATGTDVATQEAQLANTEALVVPLQTQMIQARDQLAAYLGRAPSEAELPTLTLADLTLPAELPVSLPSRLVAQRPDIRAADAQLHAATAQVGVAVANRLPQLTLAASVGSAPGAFENLFTPGNGIWSLTNQLATPIFAGGTLLHQQRAAVAAMRAAAATYRNVVVTAFQNVADALTALSQDGLALRANEDAARAAQRSLSLAQLQYGVGGVAYLTVLTAQTQYQNAAIGLIRAQAARFTDTVALLTALGGGWWNRRDVEPPPEGFFKALTP